MDYIGRARGKIAGMATEKRIRSAFTDLVNSAELDESAPTQPRDERIAFSHERLKAAWRLLEGPADQELGMQVCEQLWHDATDQLDSRRALAAHRLIGKLEAMGVRRVDQETDEGSGR